MALRSGGWPNLADKLGNWVDRKEKTTTSFGKPLKDEELAAVILGTCGSYRTMNTRYYNSKYQIEEGLAQLVKACRAARYPDKAIQETLWGLFRLGNWHVAEVYIARGKRTVMFAEDLTCENRVKGIFKGGNSLGAWQRISKSYYQLLVDRKKIENERQGTNDTWWDCLPDLKTLWMQPYDK